MRERLLTRQIDVLATSSPRPNAKSNAGRPLHLIDQMKFLVENEDVLMEHIRSFGRFNIDNYKFYADPTFAIEDYICPAVDHELMYKCLKGLDQQVEPQLETEETDKNGAVLLDLSGPLIGHLNEQRIVRMTVEQSQKLLDHQSNSLRQFELFMSNESDSEANYLRKMTLNHGDELIAKVLIDNLNESNNKEVETQSSPKEPPAVKVSSKKTKRKIKINQYNGKINLKNISNLTINTACTRNTPKSIRNVDQSTPSDDQPTSYGCDFYNRLINEIKNSLDSTTTTSPTTSSSSSASTNKTSPITPTTSNSFSTGTTPTTTSPPFDCNRMLFQNIRNLKINLPAATAAAGSSPLFTPTGTEQLPTTTTDQDDTPPVMEGDKEHPVQVEQWLKQIITQTELEPVQPSVEILEHSLITGITKQAPQCDG